MYSQVEEKSKNNNSLSKDSEVAGVQSPNGVIRCATHEFMKADQKKGLIASDEAFEAWLAPKIEEIRKIRTQRRLPAIIRIPVVVHVIHNGDAVGTGENIADGQVLSQITVLNQDFRRLTGTPGFGNGVDTTIEFCMATVDPNGNPTNGIDRRNIAPYTNSVTNGAGGADWETRADVQTAKANTIWDPTKYLNLWTFRFGGNTSANGGMSDILGYAQFPSGSGLAGMPSEDCITGENTTDGLTMAFGTFGSRAIFSTGQYSDTTFDRGRTATHELAHCFGLRHTWGDGDCSVDDFCADTPNCSGTYFAGAGDGGCTGPLQCGNTRQIENYMDYSGDLCMNMFTQNQTDRMLAVLMNSPRRDDLLVSPVCNAPQASIQFKRVDCSTRIMNKKANEGNTCGGFTEYTVPVSIAKAPTQNATVTFSIDPSSVANAKDISLQTPTVTFNAGSTTDQNLVFRVLNDAIIEPNEDLIITFTVNANGGDAFAHPEGKLLKMTILNDDFAPVSTVTNVLRSDDFESLTGWNVLDVDGDGEDWFGLTGANGIGTSPNLITGKCVSSAKDLTIIGGTGTANPNNYLISPSITIPAGSLSANVEYIVAGVGATAGNYTVYFTQNASSEANILAGTVLQASSTIGNRASVLRNHNLNAMIGQTGFIVFRHSNSITASGLLMIDNFKVSVSVNTQIQTAVNTTTAFNSNLPENGAIVARDASSQNLMAEANSTTNFNYGCVNIAVDRAGTSAVNYATNTATSLRVMSKRFQATPVNANATASGTIKFYFTEAEIAGWESATGNNRSSLKIIKDGTSASVLSTTLATFGPNTSLQGTFTNGLGGTYYFGIEENLSSESFEFENLELYPNPNTGSFNLNLKSDSDKVNVKVFDIQGREIFNRDYSNTGIFNQLIQLNNVSAGVYLVNITDGVRKTVKKIVVE